MKETSTQQMDASQVFCPNENCKARGHVGQGNIVSHGKTRPRYRCKTCGKTFSAQAGTMFEGLRKPKTLIVQVQALLSASHGGTVLNTAFIERFNGSATSTF